MEKFTHWSVELSAATRHGMRYGTILAILALYVAGKAVLLGGAPSSSLFAVPASFLLFGGVAFLLSYLDRGSRHPDLAVSPWMALILIGACTAAYVPYLVKDQDTSLPFAPGRVAVLAAASWTVLVAAVRVLWLVRKGRRT